MITIRDHQSGDLFDPWAHLGEKRRRLLERSWAGVFREHLLNHLPVGELAKHFDAAKGRPSKDLYVAIGVLILQQLHDATDAAAVEAVAFNVAWHYALDIRDETDAYLCEKTLRNYRRRIVELGLDDVLFRSLTDQLIDAFGVDTRCQRLDSTSIRSAMRSLTRLGVVVETIAKFLRELARMHPALHERVDADVIRRYVERTGEGCFARTPPSESKRRLPEAGRDLAGLVLTFKTTEAASLASFAILQRVLDEQFELVQDSQGTTEPVIRVKEPQEISCDNVRNPTDPDSSYNKHRGQGYAAQILETYQEDDGDEAGPRQPDLITHVAVHKMTKHDSQQLAPALADVRQRGLTPVQVLADSHYGSTANVAQAADQGVELVSPAMTAKGTKQGKLTLEHFDLDDDGRITRCPQGHPPVSTSVSPEKVQACFNRSICQACKQFDRCMVRAGFRRGEQGRVQYTPDRVAHRTRRLADQSSTFKHRYRWRAGVEATMSRLKHQMRLGHLRVRGSVAVTYVTLLRALGLNIRRCVAYAST